MKRKMIIFLLSLCVIALIPCTILVTGCSKGEVNNNKDAKEFKDTYESINGNTSEVSGKVFRSITIDEDNPFIYITTDELMKKVNNKDSFYVYIGSEYCPWCRSVIEMMIKSAKQNGISKIYYLEAWDGDHVETLRDKYELDDEGNIVKDIDGDSNYKKLLKLFDDYLEDYTLTDESGNEVNVGEKRIYIPSLFYIKSGKAIAYTDGISDKQESSTDELTDDILSDELSEFNSVFSKINSCDDKC